MTRNSYIDQWRGISVLMVIANHLTEYRLQGWSIDKEAGFFHRIAYRLSEYEAQWGLHVGMVGVCIFFVISGFLITTLMTKEEARNGQVSLAAFYIRRVCRILPALALYTFAVWLLGVTGAIRLQPNEVSSSSVFLCNTTLVTCGHHFNQLWSLAVEEQFYLAWPFLFILAGRFRLVFAVAGFGLCAALSAIPAMRIDLWLNNGLAFACICIGVIYSLSPQFRGWCQLTSKVPIWPFYLLLVFLLPFARTRWATLDPLISIALPFVIVLAVLSREGRVVPALAYIGLMSYSLYLWQGVFTWKSETYLAHWFAYGSLLAIPLAWLSYRYIEVPFVAVGHRLSTLTTKSPSLLAPGRST